MKQIDEYNKGLWAKFLHMMNITTYDEFSDLWFDIDTILHEMEKMLLKNNKYLVAQKEFNIRVAERLHLDKEATENNKERNMYG